MTGLVLSFVAAAAFGCAAQQQSGRHHGEPTPGSGPCPTCAYYASSRSVVGKLDSGGSFGPEQFPIQSLKVKLYASGVLIAESSMSIGDGQINDNAYVCDLEVDKEPDEAELDWVDKNSTQGTTPMSIQYGTPPDCPPR